MLQRRHTGDQLRRIEQQSVSPRNPKLTCENGPDAACKKLVALANDRGGDDNITVIVLKVKLVKISQPKINRFLALVKRNPFKILTRIK